MFCSVFLITLIGVEMTILSRIVEKVCSLCRRPILYDVGGDSDVNFKRGSSSCLECSFFVLSHYYLLIQKPDEYWLENEVLYDLMKTLQEFFVFFSMEICQYQNTFNI